MRTCTKGYLYNSIIKNLIRISLKLKATYHEDFKNRIIEKSKEIENEKDKISNKTQYLEKISTEFPIIYNRRLTSLSCVGLVPCTVQTIAFLYGISAGTNPAPIKSYHIHCITVLAAAHTKIASHCQKLIHFLFLQD